MTIFLNEPKLICLHPVKWFEVLLFNTNNSISNINNFFAHSSNHRKCLNSYIWPIDRTLTGITTPGQSETGDNDNEGLLHIPQSTRTGKSLLDGLVLYPGLFLMVGVLPLCRDTVGIFYSFKWLGSTYVWCDSFLEWGKKWYMMGEIGRM